MSKFLTKFNELTEGFIEQPVDRIYWHSKVNIGRNIRGVMLWHLKYK